MATAIAALPLGTTFGVAAYGTRDLRIESVRLSAAPECRLVQFSDLHYKGDVDYVERVINSINGLQPDFVCFTGDLIEETHHLDEALEHLAGIEAPLFGVPGNHEYWCEAPFEQYDRRFGASGGAWLVNRTATVPEKGLTIVGVAERDHEALGSARTERNILLTHYPAFVDELDGSPFDLILAGHSHGGQIRLPGVEKAFVPFGVGNYDSGSFETAGGPLYVNRGVGTAVIPLRVACPPEITLIEF
ncbi:MAG: hypothetical protein GY725_10320 [bacterium]|nr:hypothetical protein [bacterium]